MNDEELELLITLDDPEGAPEEDFNHLEANNFEYWPGKRFGESRQHVQRAEATIDSHDHRE